MTQHESSYFVDAEDLVEISRLMNQDRRLTAAVSLLPPGVDGALLHHVLDIGCGPGGWLLDLIARYPHITGIGIDSSEQMLSTARLLKQAEGQHLTFTKIDARQPLPFPDQHFDFIHMRLTQSFLHVQMWESVLSECFRLLRRGGILCITDLETIFSQKPAAETFHSLSYITYQKAHMIFSPSGRSMGLLPALRSLLPQLGFEKPQVQLHALDESQGEPFHQQALENTRILYTRMKGTLVKYGGYSEDYLDALFVEAMNDWNQPDFACISVLFTLCCRKPEQRRPMMTKRGHS